MNIGITIAVISATRNCEKNLNILVESLKSQTDKNFVWIIQDCISTDRTLEIINNITNLEISLESVQDNGIYDGINKALKRCKTDYYLIAGSDDILNNDCIENFKKTAAINKPELIAASLQVGNAILRPKKNMGWLYGMRGVASGHSVGMLIRNRLHGKFGLYTNKYRIVADQFFIKTAVNAGAKIERVDFVSGKYGSEGFSSRNLMQCLLEFTMMQLETEKIKSFQIIIFIIRIIKNYRKLVG